MIEIAALVTQARLRAAARCELLDAVVLAARAECGGTGADVAERRYAAHLLYGNRKTSRHPQREGWTVGRRRTRRLALRSCLEPQLPAGAGSRYPSLRWIGRRDQPTPYNLVTRYALGKGLSVPPFLACLVRPSFTRVSAPSRRHYSNSRAADRIRRSKARFLGNPSRVTCRYGSD